MYDHLDTVGLDVSLETAGLWGTLYSGTETGIGKSVCSMEWLVKYWQNYVIVMSYEVAEPIATWFMP